MQQAWKTSYFHNDVYDCLFTPHYAERAVYFWVYKNYNTTTLDPLTYKYETLVYNSYFYSELDNRPVSFSSTKSDCITNLLTQQKGFLNYFSLSFLIRPYSSHMNKACLHLYLSVIINTHNSTVFYPQRQLLNETFPLLPPPEVTQHNKGETGMPSVYWATLWGYAVS